PWLSPDPWFWRWVGSLAIKTRYSCMARLLIGSVYFLRLDRRRWAEMQPFPPLGTLYAASFARAQGHDVHFFDAMLAQSPQEWTAALESKKPDIAVLFDDNFNYLSKMCLTNMRKAALSMIAAGKSARARVVVCSSDAVDHPELYLEAGADAVILGEGEATLAEVVARFAREDTPDFKSIEGIAFLNDRGSLERTPRRALFR